MRPISKLLSILVLAGILAINTFSDATAQERGNKEARVSPNAAVSQTIGTTEVTVTYGRPSINGRTIFGGLVPFNKVWRTGANESTVIFFPKDVTIEGKSLPAGTYSIYSIPGEDEWTIIFNSKLSWGTEYDKSKDVLRVQAKPEKSIGLEQFMVYFQNITNDSADLVFHWDTVKVPVTIKV